MIEISVIMPEYNTRINYLENAIKSILNQTYTNFELILVDDGGINDLEKLAERFHDNRIKLIKNDRNRGLAYSLNMAINQAGGKYIARMDTDDFSDEERLEKQHEFMEQNLQYTVVGTRAREICDGKIVGTIGKEGEITKKNLINGTFPIHGTVMMRTAQIQQIEGYIDYNRAEDFALWSEILLRNNKIFVMNDVLYEYRCDTPDYKKRKLKYRKGEIKAKIYYYPKLQAKIWDYIYILRTIISGIAPIKLVKIIRKKTEIN